MSSRVNAGSGSKKVENAKSASTTISRPSEPRKRSSSNRTVSTSGGAGEGADEDDFEGAIWQPRIRGARHDEMHAIRLAHVLSCVREHRRVEIESGDGGSGKVLEKKSRYESWPTPDLQDTHSITQAVVWQNAQLLSPKDLRLHAQPLELGGHVTSCACPILYEPESLELTAPGV